jgi:hypothetical protein
MGGFDYPRKRNGKGQSFSSRMFLSRTESLTLNDIYAVQSRRKTYVNANIRRVFLRNSNENLLFGYELYFLLLFPPAQASSLFFLYIIHLSPLPYQAAPSSMISQLTIHQVSLTIYSHVS